MAINTAKLLSPSKMSSPEKVKGAPRSASSIFVLRTQVIKVEKLLMSRNVFQKKLGDKKRVEREKDIRAQREKKLESKPEKNEENESKKISAPKLGFLSVVKDFIFNVVLGYFAVRFVKHLPELIGVFKLILQVGEVVTDFGGMFLNGLVSMIDWGYKAYDATRGFIKTVGGENGLQLFDKTMGVANKVINSMLIAGMLFSDLAESDAKQKGSPVSDIVDTAIDQGAKRVGQTVATNIARTGAMGVGAAAAIVSGVGLLASALGEGAFQLKKFTKKIENDTVSGLKNAKKDPNPITRFLKVSFYNAIAMPGMKFTNFLLNGIGVTLDIIGAPFRYAIELIRFALMLASNDQKGIQEQKKNLGKFDARIRDGIREYFAAFLGPIFGFLGKKDWANQINKPGAFGSLYGDKAVKNMGYAEGGIPTNLYTRTVQKVKVRELDPQPPTLKIGSDVGGDALYPETNTKKIEVFFPNPGYAKNMNTYKVFEKSFSDIENAPFLHPLLGVTMKGLLGDKPSSIDYQNIGLGFNSFVNEIFSDIKIENDKTLLDEVGELNIRTWARDSIFSLISGPLNEIINSLAKQLNLKRNQGPGGPNPSAQKGPGATENPLDGFGGEAQFVIGDSIAHGFAGRSGNGKDTDDSMVGRKAADVLKILKSKGDALKGALIDLSTGIANSATDWASAEAQLSHLKSLGAKVRVLGVGKQWSSKNGNVNEKLEQIVKKYGFYFYGGFDASGDKALGVHGDAATYKSLKDKREGDITAAAPSSDNGSLGDLGSGKGKKIYLHWTAGSYGGVSRNYHTTITGDGKINRSTPYTSSGVPHTYNRNSNAVGISVAAMGGSPDPWSIPVKSIQYEKMAEEVARIAKGWEWSASDINIKNVMTHAEAGANKDGSKKHDNYGPAIWGGTGERWDLFHLYKNDPRGSGGDKIRSMIKGKMFHGRYVSETGKYTVHPQEFVIDADSVKIFGRDFFEMINNAENLTQRKNVAATLISMLSQYTEDGYPESEDDFTYIVEEDSIYYPLPLMVDMGMNSKSKSSSGSDPSQDMLAM